jgi:hypothetical protein
MRIRSRTVRLGAVLGIAALALTLVPAVSGAAGKSPFKAGLYVGKTSQGYPVKLRLTTGGEPCSGKPCLFAPTDEAEIYVAESCQVEGVTTNEYLALAGDRVEPSGLVRADQGGFSTTKASLEVGHNGSLTGKVRSYRTLEDGDKCDSGSVTFSATIGGSVK